MTISQHPVQQPQSWLGAERKDHTFSAVIAIAAGTVMMAFWLSTAAMPSPDRLTTTDVPIAIASALPGLAAPHGAALPPKAEPTIAAEAIEPTAKPGSASALVVLARIYRDAGNYSEEAATLERAFAEDQDAAHLMRLAILYRVSGDQAAERRTLSALADAGALDAAGQARLMRLHDDIPTASWVSSSGHFAAFVNVTNRPHMAEATTR